MTARLKDHGVSKLTKREDLRERIAAGQRRNAARGIGETARDAASEANRFVRRHPLAVLGGAIAVGLVAGALSRPGRRLSKHASLLASIAADAAIAYGMAMVEKAAKSAREQTEDPALTDKNSDEPTA